MFCKGKCEGGEILVETTGDPEQRGRYSIRYVEGSLLSGTPLSVILYVSITNLTKSDTGGYQCGLDRYFSFTDSYQDFEITITDAPTSSKPEVTLTPFPTSTSTLTTMQSLSSVPSSASPERTTQPQQGQTAPDGHGVVLYVGLILLAMFIVLSVALLIFCRKRARKELPLETEYVSDTETNQLYEEIREVDRGSRCPVETSTIYSYAKPNQPNGVESTDEYSLVTAATSQKETKGDPDNALYSVPRVAESSDVSHAEDASPSLYSTVS
ncbi:hypothetical protein KUCAC02_012937 [Chaenocephalus aceratus]|uniref:Uncharacterized protein n=1 Tax=Chaenocephalus aceratus TaxID=36190 RepID=A0ACB9XE60_CHAAC|nr:hypothetical protein KUCAC02_012937 [Chaenocephalus aceratus]